MPALTLSKHMIAVRYPGHFVRSVPDTPDTKRWYIQLFRYIFASLRIVLNDLGFGAGLEGLVRLPIE